MARIKIKKRDTSVFAFDAEDCYDQSIESPTKRYRYTSAADSGYGGSVRCPDTPPPSCSPRPPWSGDSVRCPDTPSCSPRPPWNLSPYSPRYCSSPRYYSSPNTSPKSTASQEVLSSPPQKVLSSPPQEVSPSPPSNAESMETPSPLTHHAASYATTLNASALADQEDNVSTTDTSEGSYTSILPSIANEGCEHNLKFQSYWSLSSDDSSDSSTSEDLINHIESSPDSSFEGVDPDPFAFDDFNIPPTAEIQSAGSTNDTLQYPQNINTSCLPQQHVLRGLNMECGPRHTSRQPNIPGVTGKQTEYPQLLLYEEDFPSTKNSLPINRSMDIYINRPPEALSSTGLSIDSSPRKDSLPPPPIPPELPKAKSRQKPTDNRMVEYLTSAEEPPHLQEAGPPMTAPSGLKFHKVEKVPVQLTSSSTRTTNFKLVQLYNLLGRHAVRNVSFSSQGGLQRKTLSIDKVLCREFIDNFEEGHGLQPAFSPRNDRVNNHIDIFINTPRDKMRSLAKCQSVLVGIALHKFWIELGLDNPNLPQKERKGLNNRYTSVQRTDRPGSIKFLNEFCKKHGVNGNSNIEELEQACRAAVVFLDENGCIEKISPNIIKKHYCIVTILKGEDQMYIGKLKGIQRSDPKKQSVRST